MRYCEKLLLPAIAIPRRPSTFSRPGPVQTELDRREQTMKQTVLGLLGCAFFVAMLNAVPAACAELSADSTDTFSEPMPEKRWSSFCR